MSKPESAMLVRPDGLVLIVGVEDNKIIAEIRMGEKHDTNHQDLLLIRERIYYQEFNVASRPLMGESDIEQLIEWISNHMEFGFGQFASSIAWLVQTLVVQDEAYDRATSASAAYDVL